MRISKSVFTLVAGIFLGFGASLAQAQNARLEGRLLIASEVLEELRDARDQAIPDRLLERAYGIAVIPSMTKVAFFAGGRYGKGVMVVRKPDGQFGDPVFISMTGGSFGWQWGLQQTDIVLVFTTARGVEGINGGKMTLGADASVAAGPVGRNAMAATDSTFKAEVYSYSRSKGLFAGIALDGTVISINDDANAEFYAKPGLRSQEIISGNVTTTNSSAQRFLAAISSGTGMQRTAAATLVVNGPAPAAAAPAAAPPAAAPAAGVQSFPLADPQPGAEPHTK
ncbi:MAG TPA: lipid-binding SYLF domain-containing protein [Steroidobacteraceae bacterium]